MKRISTLTIALLFACGAMGGVRVEQNGKTGHIYVDVDEKGCVYSAGETTISALLGVRQELLSLLARRDTNTTFVLHAIVPPSTNTLDAAYRHCDAVSGEIRKFADGRRIVWNDPADPKGKRIMTPNRVSLATNNYGWWTERLLAKQNEIAALKGAVDVVLLGDSITHHWERQGHASLDALRKRFSVLNIGYGGDTTSMLFWRIQNGELDGYRAKWVVLTIGTNDPIYTGPDERVSANIRQILDIIAAKQPEARVLLLPIFPRGKDGTDKKRVASNRVNARIRGFADGRKVLWLDFNAKFLDENGDTKWCMSDRLHPNAEAYRDIWLPAMLPYLSGFVDAPWVGDGLPDRNGADWYEEDPAPEFRAEFVLPPGVTATRVHFACAGFGSFAVNGRACMNEDGLDTLWSVYDKTVYAKTVACRDLLPHPATNRVSVKLGNGFYNLPPLKFWGGICFREKVAHGRPCFKLLIDDATGPLAWKWRRTNVVQNSPYLGTHIDATRPEDTDWKDAAVVKGPKGVIFDGSEKGLGMASHDVHKGAAKWLKEGEVQVVDFGVNASGVPGFTFANEARGTRIEIVYGERLNPDGTVNVLTQTAGQIKRKGRGGPGAPDVAAQRDVYVCGGAEGGERFSPPFTWHICCYAEIRGAKHLVAAPTRTVRAMACTDPKFAAPAAKALKTGNPDLRALHDVCRRTFQANLIGGVQSDCPGRERLGYGGDIVATCEAMCLNFDMRDTYLKTLQDFADEAADDGWITETAPFVGVAASGYYKQRSGPISWSLAVPVLMDAIMRHYPEAEGQALAFYPVCTRYIALLDKKYPNGIVFACIGDHEAIERATCDCVATAHWHEFVRLTATFAHRLGKTDDERRFKALDEKIVGAFRAKYVKEGIVGNGTQSAQAIGLYFGLVPGEQVPAAEAQLVKALEARDFAPVTGIFSTRYMLLYLSEHGKRDMAEKIVLHRGFPGWMHMLDSGATTLWETWKESDNWFSNCHPMFGSVDEWILRFGTQP